MWKKLIAICGILIGSFLPAHGQPPQRSDFAQLLEGSVTNIYGYPIPNVVITVESVYLRAQTSTDAAGHYKLTIPPGVYQIGTEQWVGPVANKEIYAVITRGSNYQVYFAPMIRAHIAIAKGGTVTVKLILIESGLVGSQKIAEQTTIFFPRPSHGTEFYRVKCEFLRFPEFDAGYGPDDTPSDVVVQYGHREEQGNVVRYRTPLLFDQPSSIFPEFPASGENIPIAFPSVILSYNRMTIYAQEIQFDKKKKIASTKGKVIVEDGKQRYPAKGVTINMNSQATVIRIDR